MAFLNIPTTPRANVPLLTTEGARGLWAPSSALPLHVAMMPGGAGVLAGREELPTSQAFPPTGAAEMLTPDDVNRLEVAAWYAGQVLNGVAGPVIFNANWGFGNISEEVVCTLESASTDLVILRSAHPYNFPFTRWVPNPDWPFDGPRFVGVEERGAIPLGAEVRFGWPSALANKLRPIILEMNIVEVIDDPGDVRWSARLSADVSQARVPLDAAWDAASQQWTARLFFYRQEAPLPGAVAVEGPAIGWIRVTKEVAPEAIDDAGRYLLTDTAGAPKRVWLPSMGGGAASTGTLAAIARRAADTYEWTFLVDAEVEARMTHAYEGGQHRTWVQLDDLMTGAAALLVTYHTEMRTADNAAFTGGFRAPGGCLNSRATPGRNVGGNPLGPQCHATEATGRALHHVGCWLPGGQCSHFAPRRLDGQVAGTVGLPAVHTRLDNLWDRVTVSADIILEQGLAGLTVSTTRNFSLRRPPGHQASLTSILGNYQPTLPTGLYPTREAWFFPPMGRRVIYTDPDGNTRHELVRGAWWSAPWNDGASDRDVFDAADPANAPKGLFPRHVSMAIGRMPPAGTTYPPSVNSVDSFLLPHMGGHREYLGGIRSGAPANRLIVVLSSEKWCLAFERGGAEADAELVAWIDERILS